MSLIGGAVTGVKWTSLSAGVVSLLQVAQLLILARLLEPTDFGLMALASIVLQLGRLLASAGISNAIIHRQETNRERLSTLYFTTAGAGLLAFLLVLAGTAPLGRLLDEPRLPPVLAWSAVTLVLGSLGSQFRVLLQQEMSFATLARIEMMTTASGFVFTVAAALAGAGVFALVFGGILSSALSTGALLRIGWQRWRPCWHFNPRDLRDYWRFGAYQLGEQLLSIAGTNMDKALVGVLLGSHALGLYHVAYRLMDAPYKLFNTVVTRVSFPVFAAMQHETNRVRQAFLDLVRVIAIVMLPVYFGLFAVSDQLFAVLGPQWDGAAPLLRAFAILGMFYCIGSPFGSFLLALGRADITFHMNLLRLALFGGAVLAGAQFGVLGVAWAITLTIALIMFPIGAWIRWRLVHLPMRPYADSILRSAVAGALMASTVDYAHSLQPSHWPALAHLLASVAIGFASYALIISVFEGSTLLAMLRRWRAPPTAGSWHPLNR